MKTLSEILDEHPSLTIDGYNYDMNAKDWASKRIALTHKNGFGAAMFYLSTHRLDDEYIESETLRQIIEQDPMTQRYHSDEPITLGAVILAALCRGYNIESGAKSNLNVFIF